MTASANATEVSTTIVIGGKRYTSLATNEKPQSWTEARTWAELDELLNPERY